MCVSDCLQSSRLGESANPGLSSLVTDSNLVFLNKVIAINQ